MQIIAILLKRVASTNSENAIDEIVSTMVRAKITSKYIAYENLYIKVIYDTNVYLYK